MTDVKWTNPDLTAEQATLIARRIEQNKALLESRFGSRRINPEDKEFTDFLMLVCGIAFSEAALKPVHELMPSHIFDWD